MKVILSFIFLLLLSANSFSFEKDKLAHNWQHTDFDLYLDAQEAYDMKVASPEKVLLLDVRNQAELHYTGIPNIIDANVPYRFSSTQWKMKKKGNLGTFKMPSNPDFVKGVENVLESKNMTKETPVIIMCATGHRAPFAVRKLYKAGFKEVYSQIEGFEGVKAKDGENKGKRVVSGWKVRNLPWSFDLIPEKMYFNFDPSKVK